MSAEQSGDTPVPDDGASVAEAASPKRRWLSKRNVVLLGLIGGLVSLLGVTRTWITVPPPATDVALSAISVSGTEAASAVMALTVVGIACAIAATISGRIARYIVAAVQALVGLAVIGFVLPVVLDPQLAAATKVGKSFGVAAVGDEYHLTLWPWVSALGGLIMLIAAVLLAVSSRGWRTGRRYERTSQGRAVVTEETMDDIDRWDAFTEGDDPTEGDDGIRGARFH